MTQGTVKWFNGETAKRVSVSSHRTTAPKDVFLHHSEISGEGFRSGDENARVEFETAQGDRGRKRSA